MLKNIVTGLCIGAVVFHTPISVGWTISFNGDGAVKDCLCFRGLLQMEVL